jgi:hypothetical protein
MRASFGGVPAAAGRPAVAALERAVWGDRRRPDHAGDLAPGEGAKLGQLGEQGGGQD